MRRFPSFKLMFALSLLLGLIVAAPASSSGLITGDGTWQWMNPPVQGNNISSLSFLDVNTGWAAGDGGTVLKTIDGGNNWITQIPSPNSCAGATPYGNGCNLKGISFTDVNNGWAVGAFGTIWHTVDGGSSWTAQSLPGSGCAGGSCVYASLNGVHFINSSVGIAVGPNYAFATRNGGANWVQISGVNPSHNLNVVQLVDSSNAFAVGDSGAVYKITWSGSAWAASQQTNIVPASTQSLTGLYFANATNGFAVGGGRLWRTTNGGVTWTPNTSARAESFRAVTMTGNTLVVTGGNEVVGEFTGSSVILKRTAATNWTETVDTVSAGLSAAADTGSTDKLLAVVFPGGSSTGFAAGEAGGIVKTTNTGSIWALTAGANGKRITNSSFINDTTGWMVAMDGSVSHTTNAGATWTSDASGIAAGTKLRGVSFLDASTGFAVGYSGLLGGGTNAGVVYKYVSGTWSAMSVPAGVATLEAVQMTSATTGWAVGRAPGDTGVGAGVALKTTDGSNWVFDSSGIDGNISLYGVDATSASNGWAVGENVTSGKAVLLKYAAGAWAVTEKTDSQGFLSIDMVTGSIGFAVGYESPSPIDPAYNQEGRIYKTIDGGVTWNNISPSNTQFRFLVGVSFLDANTGYVVASESGRILKTTNGGTTWTVESAGVGSNLNTVSIVPSTWSALGYAVFAGGDNASILRSPAIARDYYWTWYDNLSAGAQNWVLMANPSSAAQNLNYQLSIGGVQKDLSGWNNGLTVPGASLTPQYAGVRSGPVKATSMAGDKGIVSQRVLWAGNSLEEVVGTDAEKLSNHFYWPWYDDLTTGYTNYVMVANPGRSTVWYQISIAGVAVTGAGSSGSISPGQSAFWRDGSKQGGPLEVEAWSDAVDGAVPADVMASQRILSNGDTAFNELPGTPAGDRSDHYLWTWYDNIGAGGNNLILIGNPVDGPVDLYYTTKVGTNPVSSCSASVPRNTTAAWSEAGLRDGPVELTTYSDPSCTTLAPQAVATQRIIWGPSLEEVPGYPSTALASTYHWTWYDELSPGSQNWVLIANPNDAPVTYSVKVAGNEKEGGTIPAHGNVTPHFPNFMDGPVEVTSTGGNVMASQRVLWNGFFNETLGTVLN